MHAIRNITRLIKAAEAIIQQIVIRLENIKTGSDREKITACLYSVLLLSIV